MTAARQAVQLETVCDSIEVRTDAAITACPGPVPGFYAEFWPLPFDANELPAARQAEKRLLLARLRWRDGDCCFYCFDEVWGDEATIDHWIPRAAQGSEHLVNLRLACRRCNSSKGQQVPTVDEHPHHWPERNGAVRCYRCLAVRPPRRRPLAVLDTPPRARPVAPKPAPKPAAPIPKRQPLLEHSREGHIASIEAKIERLQVVVSAGSGTTVATAEAKIARLRAHLEAVRSGRHGRQQSVRRQAGETKGAMRAYWQQVQASWLDDGGALHPEWDDHR